MINKILLVFIISFLISSCSTKVEYQENSDVAQIRDSSGYVFGADDIPLFLGLEMIEEESTNFDTISGNIAISSYFSNSSLEEVKDFYLVTLPQIGFKLKDSIGKDVEHALFYKRNSDSLEISFRKDDDELLVKFLISSN